MSEEEVREVIAEIKRMPLSTEEKIKMLEAWLREHKLENKREYIDELLK